MLKENICDIIIRGDKLKVAVIGSGSMGTALAQHISHNVSNVFLFARREEVVSAINTKRYNIDYFPSLRLNENIRGYHFNDFHEVDLDIVIFAIPSGAVRGAVRDYFSDLTDKVVISTAKGIDYPSLMTMTEIISENSTFKDILSLSGPNFADEIAYNHIAGATIGITNPSLRPMVSELFRGFILDFSDDVKAVELCGVLKNVYAIGTGMWDSIYSNYNEHYTFLNICYKEMCNFLGVISCDKNIFTKFCCFGDYTLTANVDKSRNRTLGLMIGKNIIKTPYLESGITFEGSKSVRGIIELAHQHGIEMPIAQSVYDALNGNADPARIIHKIIQTQ